MNIEHITNNFAVAPQITAADVASLASSGYQLIICNRPDGESPEQPAFADIEAKAEELGIRTVYIPFTAQSLSVDHVERFKSVYETDQKTLAYCRSGNRCKMLFEASQRINSGA